MKCHGAAGRSLVILLIKQAGFLTRQDITERLSAMPERPFAAEFTFDEVLDRMLDDGILVAKNGHLIVTSHGDEVLAELLAKQKKNALLIIGSRSRNEDS